MIDKKIVLTFDSEEYYQVLVDLFKERFIDNKQDVVDVKMTEIRKFMHIQFTKK